MWVQFYNNFQLLSIAERHFTERLIQTSWNFKSKDVSLRHSQSFANFLQYLKNSHGYLQNSTKLFFCSV